MTDTTLTDGSPVTPDHREIDPATGMQKGYVVLSAEERSKGFVRPVRHAYRHIGARPQHPVRDLTPEEHERHKGFGYVKYEALPPETGAVGRFWTEKRLNSGCNTVTRMGQALAETYARDPKFYSGTFCCGCGTHFPVIEFVWDGSNEKVGS